MHFQSVPFLARIAKKGVGTTFIVGELCLLHAVILDVSVAAVPLPCTVIQKQKQKTGADTATPKKGLKSEAIQTPEKKAADTSARVIADRAKR